MNKFDSKIFKWLFTCFSGKFKINNIVLSLTLYLDSQVKRYPVLKSVIAASIRGQSTMCKAPYWVTL